MKIYSYNKLGEYVGESKARLNPLETELQGKDIFLIPANATTIKPPNPIEGKKRIYANGSWIYEDIVIEETIVTWEEIREKRNQLLRNTDWTQLSNCQLSEVEKEQYKQYRQALRDLPQQYENPEDVVWPQLKDYLYKFPKKPNILKKLFTKTKRIDRD